MNWVYSIEVKGVVRYIGITNNLKRRQTQHNYLFKKGEEKELYSNIRLINEDEKIVLKPIYEFSSLLDAERYECFLILKDYFSDKQLWQSPPSQVKYHQLVKKKRG